MTRILVSFGLFVALAACGAADPVEPETPGGWTRIDGGDWDDPKTYYGEFVIPDGRRISCLAWNGPAAGGLSCDWNAR